MNDPRHLRDGGSCPVDALFVARIVTTGSNPAEVLASGIDGRPVYAWDGAGRWALVIPRGERPPGSPLDA